VATPTTRWVDLPGPSGPADAVVSVEVTGAAGERPVVVLSGRPGSRAAFVQRLARAGFATVACDPRSPAELTIVLEALERGALGVAGVDATGYRLVECGTDGSTTVSRVREGARVAGPVVRAGRPDEVLETVCQWLLRTLP
jgi:hypothetical protein